MRKGWWFSSSFSRNPWLSKEKKARKWRPNPLPSSILHKTLLSVHHQGPHLGMEKLTSIQKCTKVSSFEDTKVVILEFLDYLVSFETFLYLLNHFVSFWIMLYLFKSFWILENLKIVDENPAFLVNGSSLKLAEGNGLRRREETIMLLPPFYPLCVHSTVDLVALDDATKKQNTLSHTGQNPSSVS